MKASLRDKAEAYHLDSAVHLYRRLFAWYMSLKSNEEIFGDIYHSNAWVGDESRSGDGSSLRVTEHIRKAIPKLLSDLGVKSILDAPCGDFNWMQHVELNGISYIGVDVVREMVETNYQHAREGRSFQHLDITRDPLPKVDLILCRDALVHFPYKAIWRTLNNFQRSGAIYLLTTIHLDAINHDIPIMSYHRKLDFRSEPFNFPEPLRMIEDWKLNKKLALWRLADLNLAEGLKS